jgi:anti-sigma regulatory factor (Ser/Thr protein kinase)
MAKRKYMRYLSYNEKMYRQIKFSFSGDVPFEKVLTALNRIDFNGCIQNDEQAVYAVLELVSNSLRAHREKEVREKIVLKIRGEEDHVRFRLTDRGGGFDVSRLPYDIYSPVEEINATSEAFEAYREQYDYRRFGMGLLLARKVFPGFRLTFEEEDGRVAGTIIDLSTRAFNHAHFSEIVRETGGVH